LTIILSVAGVRTAVSLYVPKISGVSPLARLVYLEPHRPFRRGLPIGRRGDQGCKSLNPARAERESFFPGKDTVTGPTFRFRCIFRSALYGLPDWPSNSSEFERPPRRARPERCDPDGVLPVRQLDGKYPFRAWAIARALFRFSGAVPFPRRERQRARGKGKQRQSGACENLVRWTPGRDRVSKKNARLTALRSGLRLRLV
jgi:hypothetical protein